VLLFSVAICFSYK